MTAKTACLVFHCFGEESYVNRLAQEVVPVHRALTNYDKTVLLRHETDIGCFELSEAAEKKATVLDIPTKENLAKYLNELGDEGYIVDVYIFSHGWTNQFRSSKGTYGDNETTTGRFLEGNVRPLKLRMVWQCNCYGSTLNDTWAKLGAKAAGGSRFINFYPTRFAKFAKLWVEGKPFKEALAEANKPLWKRMWVHIYIIGDAFARTEKWGGTFTNAFGVLGFGSSALKYFKECWDSKNPIAPDQSGREYMSWCSEMLVEGDGTLTKGSTDLEW